MLDENRGKPESLVEEFSHYNSEIPFFEKARRLVFNYVSAHLEKTDSHVKFFPSDVYVVWFSKALQNWKALLSTTLPDGMYYEVTYSGDNKEAYLDAYKKFENVVYHDSCETENN